MHDTCVYRRPITYLCTIIYLTSSLFPCESQLPQVAGGLLQAGVVICCCKLSSANTWASLVMQPRCEHLKSLIVSEQAFKSENRDLA